MSKPKCWLCGSNKSITHHHILNREWKPIKNRTIPLCDECHKFIHHHYPDDIDKLFKIKNLSMSKQLRIINKLDKQLNQAIRQKIKWRNRCLNKEYKKPYGVRM